METDVWKCIFTASWLLSPCFYCFLSSSSQVKWAWSGLPWHLHFNLLQSRVWTLSQSHPLIPWSLILTDHKWLSTNSQLCPSPGSWVHWQCWRSVRSWWRGWWSLGPFVRRGLTRFGYVKTGRGQRYWWTTCFPATTMATSSSPRLGTEGGSRGNTW